MADTEVLFMLSEFVASVVIVPFVNVKIPLMPRLIGLFNTNPFGLFNDIELKVNADE
jgi:hypothetical protein